MSQSDPTDDRCSDSTDIDSNSRLFENATPADDSNVRHVAASPDTIDSHPTWNHFEAGVDAEGDPVLF